ncbi:MAG: hypothetical protein RR816_03725 [Clostridia bacterium]
MRLFFETGDQAHIFLAVLPIGFLLAMSFDASSFAGKLRPVMDVLCLLMSGLAFIMLLLVFRDDGLRVYHMLALLTGAVLYLCGMGRLFRAIGRKLSRFLAQRAEQKFKRNEASSQEI